MVIYLGHRPFAATRLGLDRACGWIWDPLRDRAPPSHACTGSCCSNTRNAQVAHVTTRWAFAEKPLIAAAFWPPGCGS